MIKIITDSTSYIPAELVEKYDITVLSHCITIDGQGYLETEISNFSFFEKIRNMNELPVSNPPTYDTILEAFEKEVKAGNTVLGIFISNLASETVQRANRAKDVLLKKYPRSNITVIDSKNTCMALGIVALAAAEKHQEGAWLEDVVEAANAAVLRNRLLFIPKKLDHMARSGKIGKAKALIGDFMQLVPLLTTSKGEIAPLETVRTRGKAIDRMVEIMKEDADKYGVQKVVVTHIDDIEEAQELSKKIEGILDLPVEISEIGPAVGVSIGPGTLGLIYNTMEAHPLNI
ncbi:MAG: DegV family protein [Eubacteriales bacterium]